MFKAFLDSGVPDYFPTDDKSYYCHFDRAHWLEAVENDNIDMMEMGFNGASRTGGQKSQHNTGEAGTETRCETRD